MDRLQMTKKASKKAPAKKTAAKKVVAKKAPAKKVETALSPLIALTVENALKRHKQAGQDALRSIALNQRTVSDAFYDIAISLNVLRQKEVYVALGYESFDAVIPSTGLSRSLCFQLVQLPEHFSRDTAISLGPDRSRALIRYVNATPEEDDAETLAREDAVIAGKPLSELTVDEIDQAAREATPPEKQKTRPGEKEAHEVRRAVQKKLEKLKANVQVKRSKGAWVAVVTMPVESALKLKG
jgi:hypothetical protein